jgi:hypothetical protein
MITWDEPKRRENLRKHGIDLALLEDVFDAPLLTVEDDREAYGEQRQQSLAFWRGRVVFLIWTARPHAAHLIPCRHANKRQTQNYFAAVQP